jgi:hypothetical protein
MPDSIMGKRRSETNDGNPKMLLRPWDNGDLAFQGDEQLFDHGLVCGQMQDDCILPPDISE